MGYAKRMMEERESRGYADTSDLLVCHNCISDHYICSAIEDSEVDQGCSFCDAKRASPFAELLAILMETIHHYYTDPANELPYESAEGGYQGEVLNTIEVLSNLGSWAEHDDICRRASEAIDADAWCKKDYFGLTPYEQLKYGWAAFVEQIRHRTRHLFFEEPTSWHSKHSDGILPQHMLQELGSLFEEHSLYRTLDTSQELSRARVIKAGERPCTAQDLGTVPEALANMANRMSPAGIPMFYAGLDAQTAIAETYEPRRGRGREIAMATFRPVRPLNVLDLQNLPPIPSIFNPEDRASRDAIRFLHAFADDIRKPVQRDQSAHTEYVATQVVTEYVRHRLTHRGSRVDGIMYRSSRHNGGVSVVIFATSEQCRPIPWHTPDKQLLHFVRVEYMMPPKKQRKKP